MKILRTLAVIFTAFIVFISCQKQLDFGTDGVSVGTLKSSLTGDCLPVSVNGLFKVDSVLNNNSYVDIQVDVSIEGTFDVKTDTVNGYSFSKTGSVGKGINTIRLYPSGKPLIGGTNIFTVKYGASTCTFSITVNTSPAVYTLGGSPGACTGFILAGTYTAGVALSATNTVKVDVNVISGGAYTINTPTLNGVIFTATGTFTTTGPQTVILTGSGTPVNAGSFTFPASGSANTCSFPVTFTGTPPPANSDYIPETSFSNWSDKLLGGAPSDTSYVQVSPNTKVINTVTYRIFEVKDTGTPVDSFFHHKNGGLYYQLYDGDYGIFDVPFNKDGLILDSTKAVGGTWTITLGTNTVGGFPVNVKIDCQILARNFSATVAGNNYTQIIKVKYNYMGDIGAGYTLFGEEERWYAKGFGLIYDKTNDVPVTTTTELETTRIQIF